VHVTGEPRVLAARTGTTWQPTERDRDGDGAFCAADAYEVLWICEDRQLAVDRCAATVDELDRLDLADCTPSGQMIPVTGTLAQAAAITLGPQTETHSQGDFAVRVAAGTYDLVVTNTVLQSPDVPLAYVRRGLEVREPTHLGSIDLAGMGAPMRPVAFEVRNQLPGDSIYTDTELRTSRGYSVTSYESDAAYLVPDELLDDGDRQYVVVEASTTGRGRAVSREVSTADTQVVLELPDLPQNVTFAPTGGGRFTWPAIAGTDYASVQTYLYQLPALDQLSFRATRGWIRLRGLETFDIAPDHPAFDASRFSFATRYAWSFAVNTATTTATVNAIVDP
jgi:hypothetical protein